MNKTTSSFLAGLLIGALIATGGFTIFLKSQKSGGTVTTQQTVLKFGHGLDTAHPVHLAALYMKERLELISGGDITIDIYPGAVLGSEVQSVEQLQNGSLAMTCQSMAALENFIPSLATFSLPYVFRDGEHYWEVLNGEIGRNIMEKGEAKFLRGLCFYDAGSRNFYTKETPVRTPDDLKGLKIRVMNSATAIDMVKALGGSPTPINWGELYSALAQGTVDGAENNPPSFASNRHFEVCKHFTLDGHTRIPDMLLMSSKVWEKLSPQAQAWVLQAAQESSDYQRDLWKKKSDLALQQAESEGVTIYEVDTALFQAKVQPMFEAVESAEVRELLKAIAAVK